MIETRANFSFMLVGLVLLWLTMPMLTLVSTGVGTIGLYVTINATLCLGAWSLSKERGFFLVAAGITVAAVICSIVTYMTGNAVAKFLTLSLGIIFWSTCTWFVARHLLVSGPVDKNRIAGAICIYLIAAVIWAHLYTLVNFLVPGSFSGLNGVPHEKQYPEFIYYSFVTLTTLGYGDMSPVHPVARVLAQMEAVFGQLYIAILVATLVGIRISGTSSSN